MRNKNQKKGLIPKLVRKIGECSANQTCAWWSYQPKLPESLKKDKN